MMTGSTNPFAYSDPIWQHFAAPTHAGQFDRTTPGVIRAQAGSRASESILSLQFRVQAGRVAEARFKAYGCPASIAVGDWIAQWSVGKSADELAGINATSLREVLEIPDERAHCALLGEDAVRALLKDWPVQTSRT